MTRTTFLRTPYNYAAEEVSHETGVECPADDEHAADQEHKDDCDINILVARFGLAGLMPDNFQWPEIDLTHATDYHTAMNVLVQAEQAFKQLPADLRYRFKNDPHQLDMFLHDGNNRDEAVKLGLIAPPKETARDGTPLPTRTTELQSPPPAPGNKEQPK